MTTTNLGPKENWATEASVKRNNEPIKDALKVYLSNARTCLEIASGWGEHVKSWASTYQQCEFQPTEADDQMLLRLTANVHEISNIRKPFRLDVLEEEGWNALGEAKFDVILADNLIHIAPWQVTQALFAHAREFLTSETGVLGHYGALIIDGDFQSEGNINFDKDIRSRNPEYGLRELNEVKKVAEQNGFRLIECKEMPSNNWFCFYGFRSH